MIDRSVWVHGGLAVVAVGLAAVAWLRPSGNEDAGEVELIAGDASDVSEVRWSDADADIIVTREGDGTQVSVTSKRAVASTAMASAGPQAPAAPVKTTRVYPGSQAARDLFGRLVPFRAARDLGPVEADKLPQFGLSNLASTLTLRFGPREEKLEVGSTSFGGGGTYARGSNGHVYLINAMLVGELRNGAAVLTERNLVVAARDKIERVVIRSGAKSREVVQRFADDRARAYFANPAEPDTRLVQTTNWLDRLMRTRMVDFSNQKPDGPAALVVELSDSHKSLGKVQLWQPTESGALVEATGYASAVTIPKPTAEMLLKDVDGVLGEKP